MKDISKIAAEFAALDFLLEIAATYGIDSMQMQFALELVENDLNQPETPGTGKEEL